MVNAQRLTMMKTSAFLINTSRRPLINEQYLADALNAGQVSLSGNTLVVPILVGLPSSSRSLSRSSSDLGLAHLAKADESSSTTITTPIETKMMTDEDRAMIETKIRRPEATLLKCISICQILLQQNV